MLKKHTKIGGKKMNNIGKEIIRAVDKATESRINRRITGLNHASQAGWVNECLRYLCLKRLVPDEEALHDIERQRRFDEGKAQEKIMRAELIEAGVKIVKTTKKLNWEKYKLAGELDDIVLQNGNKFPIDYKTCSSYMFSQVKRCNNAEDLLKSKFHWIRHYPTQLQIYIMLAKREGLIESDTGILYFKDKESASKYSIDIPLNVSYTNYVLKALEKVNNFVLQNKVPIPDHVEDCKHCDFFNYCFPGSDFARESIAVIPDAEMEIKLKRREKLESASREYKKLDREIKDCFKGQDVMCGDFRVWTTSYDVTGYDVPTEIKEEYKTKLTRERVNIRNLARPV